MRKIRGMLWAERAWDPVSGCTKTSPGCVNCMSWQSVSRWYSFRPTIRPEELDVPRKDLVGREVFVASLGDLFHNDIPHKFIRKVFDVMWETPQHLYYLLTKRPEKMRECLCAYPFWPLPNVNIGVSAENQACLDQRAPFLVDIPIHDNRVRFLSCEPLLGPVHISQFATHLGWIICGRERGRGLRPTDPIWLDELKQECTSYGLPVYHHRSEDPKELQKPKQKEDKVIKLLRTIPRNRTYLEIDEALLEDLAGIEISAGGQSYIISFSKSTTPPPRKVEATGTDELIITEDNFPELLKQAREKKGMTNGELAKAAGVGRSTLDKYTSGRTMPRMVNLTRLNNTLGTSWVR